MTSNANCPYCQAPLNVTDTVGEQPAVCPHCLTNIPNPQLAPAGDAPNVLRDIRRKVRGLGWFFWLIIGLGIGLCVFGIVEYKVNPGNSRRVFPASFDLCPGFAGLDIFVLLAILVPLWRYLKAKHFNGQVDDAAGRFIALAILTVALAIAIGAFFCAVCMAVA